MGVPGRLAPRPVGPSVVELPDLSLCGVTFARVLVLGRAVLSLPIWRAVASICCAIRRAKIVAASIDIAYSDIAYSAFGVQKPNVAASIDIAYWRAVYSPRLFGVDPVRVDRTKAEVLSSPIRRAKPASIDIAYSTCKAEKNDRRRISSFMRPRTIVASIRAALAHHARGVRANDRIVFRKCMSVQDVFSCTCKA